MSQLARQKVHTQCCVIVDPPTSGEIAVAEKSAKQQIRSLISTWSNAWSNQDIDTYLDSYASDHRGEKHPTVFQWRDWRKERLLTPDRIEVSISKNSVKLNNQGADLATAQFTQAYKTPLYADQVIKELRFEKQSNGWKIVRERTLVTLSIGQF